MLNSALRRSGGSLILTIPPAYIEQNHLDAGSRLRIEISGSQLVLCASPTKPKLRDLLKATPQGKQRLAGWDEMAIAGAEL